MSEQVAMTLTEYRATKGLTQQQVAEALGLSKSRISEIESGSGCSLETALKIERFTRGKVGPSDVAKAARATAKT